MYICNTTICLFNRYSNNFDFVEAIAFKFSVTINPKHNAEINWKYAPDFELETHQQD